MTIPFEAAKESVSRAARTTRAFVKEHVQTSAKSTTDGFTLTVHVRLRGKDAPLPTT